MEDTYVEQVGGSHYKKPYQHWDWVTDEEVPYLLAVATKYIDRWRTKNGIEDLKKSITYLKKAKVMGIEYTPNNNDNFDKFTENSVPEDKDIMLRIIYMEHDCNYLDRYIGSIEAIEVLIEKYDGTEEAGLAYINQD